MKRISAFSAFSALSALSAFLAVVAVSCSRPELSGQALPRVSGMAGTDTLAVSVSKLVRQEFHSTLVCNGRLEACRSAQLRFDLQGRLLHVNVHEGEFVQPGQVIAAIDDRDSRIQVESARMGLNSSLLALQDRLADMDMTLADTLLLTREQKMSLWLSTGYSQAGLALKVAERQLENCVLRAPFAGRIADISGHEYQYAQGDFCRLVDDSRFNVWFQVLESELKGISEGKRVTVSPYSDSGIKAKGMVVSVNPRVSDNGMVNVMAQIDGARGLIDGMNVQICLINPFPDSFVVPRSAVRSSNGHHLLFTYSAGKSVWNYIEIVGANESEYSVIPDERRNSPLKEGDLVITGGVDNLTDGSPVRIIR